MNQGMLATFGKLFFAATILSMTALAPANALTSASEAETANSPATSQLSSTEQSPEVLISQSSDDAEAIELSEGVSRIILQQVAKSQNLSLASLRVAKAEKVEWSDGC